MEYEPHRPNYTDLKNDAERVNEQQQQTGQQEQQHGQEQTRQAEAEPSRPETVNRSVTWPDSPRMDLQQAAAAAQAKVDNERVQANWVKSLQNPEFRNKREEQFQAQQNAAEHEKGNDGPEHTGGPDDHKR